MPYRLIALLLSAWLAAASMASEDPADLIVRQRVLERALQSPRTGVALSWSNPGTGGSGSVTVLRAYTRDGVDCRDFRERLRAASGPQREFTASACRDPDGRWTRTESAATQAAAAPVSPPTRSTAPAGAEPAPAAPGGGILSGLSRGISGVLGGGGGDSGRTSTIGLRGLSADDLTTAHADPEQLRRLEHHRVGAEDAQRYAREAGLESHQLPYLAAPGPARSTGDAWREERDL